MDVIPKIPTDKTECITFEKYKNDLGYGFIQFCLDKNKYSTPAHRVVYMVYHNIDLTTDQVIRHKCDNPSCININHLLIGTQADNIKDKVERNRQATGSKNGRFIDGRSKIHKNRIRKPNPIIKGHHPKNSALTLERAKEVKEKLFNFKGSLKDIAKVLEIPYQLARDIRSGRSYINV